MGDFRAFYCAARVVLDGGNPYASQPIRACERTPQPYGLYSSEPAVSVPAPYPGYTLLLWIPFAALPYVAACVAWGALMIAALVFSAVELARLTSRPFAGVLFLLACGFALAVLPIGELPPLILAALLTAMTALRSDKYWTAAAALAVVALLPQIAVPVWISALVYERRLRLPLAVAGGLLILLDLLAGGPVLALSYFTAVLPQHAQSEVGYIMQYGLTWIAHGLGASDGLAIGAGQISYVAMLAAGIWTAGKLAMRFGDRAFTVAVPVAFIVTGGSFIHFTDILLSLPAAVLLWPRTSGLARACTVAATFLIAFPWLFVTQIWVIVPITCFTVAIALCLFDFTIRDAMRAAFLPLGICALILAVASHTGPQLASHLPAAHLDQSLAQASWAAKIRSGLVSSGGVWWVAKMPTWIGLVLLATACAFVSLRRAPFAERRAGA